MSNVEDYNRKIGVIKAITDDQIKVPHHIPVNIYIMEAHYLYDWCQDDKEELMAKGLDWTVVEDLPVRCGALSEAESKWINQQSQRRVSAKIWLPEASKGNDLRNELIHHFNYAFRDDSSLIVQVKEIAERHSHEGMLQGLKELSALGKANRDLLTKIGFDFTLLDIAGKKSGELEKMRAAGSCNCENYREVKKIRDQAYTHLKEAVDYIREYARYVFWRNTGRLKGYRSNYLRNVKRKIARRNALRGPETGTEALTIET
jgi:hypothetical protein